MEEYEIKFLDIDVESLGQKLRALGARKVSDSRYRRMVFDHSDFRLDADHSWLRLRDEGDTVTLTFKQRLGANADAPGKDTGMYEQEVIVSDFEKTKDILLRAGLVEKMYQENRRVRYVKGDVEYDIDTWPLIPPYLEIEGKDWESVYLAGEELGFDRSLAQICSTNQIYKMHGLDDRNYTKLTFDEQVERTQDRF